MITFISDYQDLLMNLFVISFLIGIAEIYRRLRNHPKTSQMQFEEQLAIEFADLREYLNQEDQYENIMAARDYFIEKWKGLLKYDTLKHYEDQIFDIIKQKKIR